MILFGGATLIAKYEEDIAYYRDRIEKLEFRERHLLDALLKKAGSYPIPEQDNQPTPITETRDDMFDLDSVMRNDFILEARDSGIGLEEASQLWEAKKEKRWTPPGQLGT